MNLQLDSIDCYMQAFDSMLVVVGNQVVDRQLDMVKQVGILVVLGMPVLGNLVAFDTQEVHMEIEAHIQVEPVWVEIQDIAEFV